MKTILFKAACIGALLLGSAAVHAETKADAKARRHEISVSWGDQIFEQFNWRNPAYIVDNMPETVNFSTKENHRFSQHWALSYQYRLKHWLGLGMVMDGSACIWDDVVRNGKGVERSRTKNQYFANIALVPTVRFTYFRHEYVNIYSAIGVGMNINTGTEKNALGQRTEYSGAANLTFVGVSANYKQWFALFELGGLYALKNQQTIYMLNSRMFSVGIGMRF